MSGFELHSRMRCCITPRHLWCPWDPLFQKQLSRMWILCSVSFFDQGSLLFFYWDAFSTDLIRSYLTVYIRWELGGWKFGNSFGLEGMQKHTPWLHSISWNKKNNNYPHRFLQTQWCLIRIEGNMLILYTHTMDVGFKQQPFWGVFHRAGFLALLSNLSDLR